MATFKLAKERLNTGSQMGGLNTTLLNGNIGGDIRAPGINVNAGNVKYSNMTPNSVIPDTKLSAMAQASNVLYQSAMDYSQRQDKFIADSKVLALNENLRKSFDGEVDDNGNITGGYGNTTLGEASSGYGSFSESVEKQVKETLDSMTPQQKYFSFKGVAGLRDSYLGKGATHASKELTLAQAEISDRAFNTGLENIGSGNNTYENIEYSLGFYTNDAKEMKARKNQITGAALDHKLTTEGPMAAVTFAVGMAKRGVGDSAVIQSFIERVKSNVHSDLIRKDTANNIVRAEKQRAVEDEWSEQAIHSVGRNDGTFGTLMSAMESKMSPGDFNKIMPDHIKSLVVELVTLESDTVGDKAAGFAIAAKKLREKKDQIPIDLWDDVVMELEVQSEALDDAELKDLADARKRTENDKYEQEQYELKVINSYAKGMRAPNGSIEKYEAEDMLTHIYQTTEDESVRVRAKRFLDNSINPNEGAVLLTAYTDDYQSYIDGVKDYNKLDISETSRLQLAKSVESDRISQGQRYRKSASDNLLTYYKLKRTGPGMLGITDGNMTAGAAKSNYQEALDRFNTIFTELTTGKDKVSAPEAAKDAMSAVLTDPMYRRKMLRLPEGEPGPGKGGDKVGFSGQLDDIEDNHYIASSIPGIEGDANLTQYARTIGATPDTEGRHPREVLLSRVVEVGKALVDMHSRATTVSEKSRISAMMNNLQMQSMAMENMIAEAQSEFVETGKIINTDDGDSNTKDSIKGSQREANTNTPEMNTPEGQLAKKEVISLIDALTGGIGLVESRHKKGLGYYGRHIVDQITSDNSNTGKIMQSRFGYPSNDQRKGAER